MTTIKRTLSYPVWLEQAVKFLSVGILNTALDVSLYFVLTRWIGILAAWRVVTKGISYGFGVLNSFYWNRSWTFQSEARAASTLAPFVLVNLAALGINAGIMHVCLNAFDLPELLSLALATGTAFLWNFAVNKLVVFKK
jgi:putative flippase GtrA